ncbi:MAG: hypothetical protein JG782_1588 [Anaerophaga sp.]|nr:hypothetical protein [Anaerophaga sp.]
MRFVYVLFHAKNAKLKECKNRKEKISSVYN